MPIYDETGVDITTVIQKEWEALFSNEDVLPINRHETQHRLRQAIREVKEIVKHSYERRDTERKRRIQELQMSLKPCDQKQATVLRRIQKGEAINQLFEKLKALRQKRVKSGVTRIEVPMHEGIDPKVCTEWKQLDIPSDVLHHLRERNRSHFGQAAGTPFTIPPLSENLSFTGHTEAASNILRGECIYRGTDPNVTLLLRHLKQTQEVSTFTFPVQVSEEEYVGKLKAWRETTATSPSGMHLGHYKALLARHSFTEIPEDEDDEHREKREALNRKQNEMLQVHSTLLNYALERGYSYRRWQKVANTILFKEKGNIRIHRTRVIHLYEADYNLAIGVKWPQALNHAESLNLLHDGQFGSRPHRNAIDPVFLEELQLEVSRITRQEVAQTNYDATACNDRIVPNLAMLASRKFGVPSAVAHSNASTLQQARYHIRTDLGLSEEGYQHQDTAPIFGTGQGSGNSPAIWCFLSSVLYDCYDEVAIPATYCSPDRSGSFQIGMIGFVDDSNGQTNDFQVGAKTDDASKQLMDNTRHNAQQWANLLGASGGALELPKCSYHIVWWHFTKQGAPILYSDAHTFGDVSVIDPTSKEAHKLQYLSPYKAHKTLGHCKEPAGKQKKQGDVLRDNSDSLTEFLTSTSLTREEAWTFYFACYLPSVTYPFANSYFTKNQLTNIQRRAMARIIPKCCFNRHTKREVIFGPMELGGANFRHLHDQQGIGQLQLFLRHWRSHSTAGQMLKCLVHWAQYAVGVSTPILEHVQVELLHLESKWLSSVRSYLADIKAGIQLDSPGVPELEREGDSFIMDRILASKRFTSHEIRLLNYCRLYINAVTIADLTTTAGDQFDLNKLSGESSLLSTYNTWMPIKQDKPSPSVWRLWKRANTIWSSSDGVLVEPLGARIRPAHERRIQVFAQHFGHRLFIRIHQSYYICKSTGENRFQQSKRRNIHVCLPKQTVPVEVKFVGETDEWEIVQRTQIRLDSRNPISQPMTFGAYVETLDAWEIDLLRHKQCFADPMMISLELSFQFMAGSDGSERYGTHGAFGWMVSNLSGERIASGMGPSRGYRMDSYRAESSGMLSFLRFLIRMAEFTQQAASDWHGTVGTDSQSLLDRLFGKKAKTAEECYGSDILDINVLTP